MDIGQIIDFDQQLLLRLNGSDSMFVDALALTLTSAYTWVPLYVALLYIVVKNNEKWKQMFLIIGASALCILLASGFSEGIVKPFVCRLRPSHDPLLVNVIDLSNGYQGTGYSFFSAHAANTFSIAIFFLLLVRNRIFGVAMLLWSFINCWTRLYLGVHYPSDILVGVLWGLFVGILVYFIFLFFYKKTTPKLHYISSKYTPTGYSLSDIDIVLNIMTLLGIYSLVRAVIIAN